MSEGQPDIEPNAAMRIANALKFEQCITKWLTLHLGVNLD